MFYLALINQFKKISGSRQEHEAPPIPNKYFKLSDQGKQYYYIVDPSLTRTVLEDPTTYKQDIFLSRIVYENSNQEKSNLKWTRYFVDNSPEFKDGSDHKATKQRLARTLENIHSSWKDNISLNQSEFIDMYADTSIRSALQVSREVVRFYLRKIFSQILARDIVVSDAVLDAPDIFTPTIKIKSNLELLNQAVDEFFDGNQIEAEKLSPEILLALLSFIYMSVRPLTACLTTLFNELIREKCIRSAEYYSGFGMVPTFFVAREATKDALLDDLAILKGVKLYLYLYDSTGCPFSKMSLPFGRGKHICPGTLASKLIVKEVMSLIADQEISMSFSHRLVESKVLHNTSNAFLGFVN